MAEYRITKYDPAHRDADGAYRVDAWTSASDIGNEIGGKVVALSEYLQFEDAYVAAALEVAEMPRFGTLSIVGLENRGSRGGLIPGLSDLYDTLEPPPSEGLRVSGQRLAHIVRLCLRERIWCKLVSDTGAYIHFGYDYYMYAGYPGGERRRPSFDGLFVEEFQSPYGGDDR